MKWANSQSKNVLFLNTQNMCDSHSVLQYFIESDMFPIKSYKYKLKNCQSEVRVFNSIFSCSRCKKICMHKSKKRNSENPL